MTAVDGMERLRYGMNSVSGTEQLRFGMDSVNGNEQEIPRCGHVSTSALVAVCKGLQ